ncbi:MAG: N-acetylmuramoyl-L-alanine amidase, partial [Muribaculaceae bacterium]|nr:N-acetylmuramoyl-L-alanine amidase [Muribaculaceae bacterium]
MAAMLMYTATIAAQPFVVVIDPGHGGKDYGAIGSKTNEKTVVLAVGRLLGKKIADKYSSKEVKVVYTRDNDYFVTLQGRADIANKAKGDLFISIHANSVDKRNRNRKTVNGTSVY